MEIWNHFTFREDSHPLTSRYMKQNGIKYDCGAILNGVDISENDPHWPVLEQLLKQENIIRLVLSETKFTKSELLEAEWLTLRSRWYYDYPQPENQYRDITYTSEFRCPCRDCGIELIQKDRFRFKRTPKWGKRNFCMTNWVYDELFVSTKAKELLEGSDLKGFSFLEVNSKSGKETLPDVFQIQIPYILPEGIVDKTSNIKRIFVCPICGKQKLCGNGRGQFVFRKDAFIDAPDFVKSAEWFGGGTSASRRILINQKAYRFITENKLDSSLVFEPIRLV